MFDKDKLIDASVSAQIGCPEIIFNLLSVARESSTPEWLARKRLSEARTAAERLLVAILAAEQSGSPRATPAPANDAHAEVGASA